MNIKIITVGKIKDKRIKGSADDYLTRIRSGMRISLDHIPKQNDIEKEGEIILSRINRLQNRTFLQNGFPPKTRMCKKTVVALSEEGHQVSTREFEKLFSPETKLVFIIGSASGLHKRVKKGSDTMISLSKMTLPHQMAFLILTEQIYRVWTLKQGIGYHK